MARSSFHALMGATSTPMDASPPEAGAGGAGAGLPGVLSGTMSMSFK